MKQYDNIESKNILKPAHADMMKRVRETAKWSQLYKSGQSIPPKNKASFLNNEDEDEEDIDATKNHNDGTFRNDFDNEEVTRVPYDG